ncbi:MAG: FAD-binding protein [Bacteroidetes bacterium]|nr:MAG: FAD-binding protein [Bacteroidota bacterium]
MQKNLSLKLLPSEAASESIIKEYISKSTGVPLSKVTGFYITKSSIDARGKTVWVNLTVHTYINEPFQHRPQLSFDFKNVKKSGRKVIIIGSGPAGLFAALKFLEKNIQPIILERGKDVRARRRDLAALNKEGVLNPESNYCFGEGGAGTYSDGKLYTRSSKRGDINRILNLFAHFGAEENILYEAHPHIGTNKLPHIITAMRKTILDCGGLFFFEKKVVGFEIQRDLISKVITSDGNSFEGDAVILATGHSARDIFQMLQSKKIKIEAKPFALGVRIEHPQELIDKIQYHGKSWEYFKREPFLPPASYSLVEQIKDCGVFSFCMCPGGIIAPASTNENELVVNGWSPSKRNNPYANSGMVVTVEQKHLRAFEKSGELAAMNFQKSVEQKAFQNGGGKYVAPAQRMVDFTSNKISTDLPDCSYLPGTHSASLKNVLPDFIYQSLAEAFKEFGKKMKGYYTNEAIVVATESRTSSPVRIPRSEALLHHPQIKNLYPCGEGAGFAGGIVSAAMDGERLAETIASKLAGV